MSPRVRRARPRPPTTKAARRTKPGREREAPEQEERIPQPSMADHARPIKATLRVNDAGEHEVANDRVQPAPDHEDDRAEPGDSP